MGRGLSDLQKCILRLAGQNLGLSGPHVTNREVLIHHYGFAFEMPPMVPPARIRRFRSEVKDEGTWDGRRLRADDGADLTGKAIKVRDIGERRVGAARAALGRALTRLISRGLLEYKGGRFWGYYLTLSGQSEADKLLTVKPHALGETVNR